MTSAAYYLPRENDDHTGSDCFLCGEMLLDDDPCPCLPVEPPVEEWDVWGDR